MTERDSHDLVDALRQPDTNIAAAAAERLDKRASIQDLPRLRNYSEMMILSCEKPLLGPFQKLRAPRLDANC